MYRFGATVSCSCAVREVRQHRGGHALLPPQLRLLRVSLQRDVSLGTRRRRRPKQVSAAAVAVHQHSSAPGWTLT